MSASMKGFEPDAAQNDRASAAPCDLRFGRSGGWEPRACILLDGDTAIPPRSGLALHEHACYAWCEGAMSQAHSAISLLHRLDSP